MLANVRAPCRSLFTTLIMYSHLVLTVKGAYNSGYAVLGATAVTTAALVLM